MKRDTCKAYLGLEIGLHGCVDDTAKIIQDLKVWLLQRLQPDYDSDIDIDIADYTP